MEEINEEVAYWQAQFADAVAKMNRWREDYEKLAEGVGYGERPEGHSCMIVADPEVIIEAFKGLQSQLEDAKEKLEDEKGALLCCEVAQCHLAQKVIDKAVAAERARCVRIANDIANRIARHENPKVARAEAKHTPPTFVALGIAEEIADALANSS